MTIPIDRLIRSRRKTIALIIERDGKLTVRAPLRIAEGRIHAFVDSHAKWIAKNKARIDAAPKPMIRRYEEGEVFPYLGKTYPLRIVEHQRPALSFTGSQFLLARSAIPKAQESFSRWYRKEASNVLSERAQEIAHMYGYRYEKIRISSARTRWGSCSSKNSLSFTYRLVMAPMDAIDYVVMHELVHTKIKNHSKIFWNKVAEHMPDYKVRLTWLKNNGKFLI